MWNKIRRAVTPSIVVVLAAYGMAYAASGSPNPADLVSNHGKAAKVSDKPDKTPKATDDAADAAKTPKPEKTPKPSHGPKRSTEGCPDGFTGNHGQSVSKSDDHKAAAKSDCGKPVHPEKSPAVSPATSDDAQEQGEVEQGDDKKPETSESPDPDDNGDQHSNDHHGNGDTHGNDG